MNLSHLNQLLKNEPSYRLQQVKAALFKNLIDDWSQATNLPLILREKLNKECPLLIKAKTFIAKDEKTVKVLITLTDGLKIESVLMRYQDGRNTVCVSSQMGCPLGCLFCATGKMGFKRNLEVSEIIEQVLFFARFLKKNYQPPETVNNIVFMGMGEPFLNYKNVLEAIKILNDKNGFNLGTRRFSISTAGIVEGINKLAEEKLAINLSISFHGPEEKLRSEMMPINKKYSLRKVIKAVDDYIKKTHRKVMFEYIMIKDLNDTDECAKKLAKLMRKRLYMVNLISYNPTGIFKPSLPERIKKFKEILKKEGVFVTERYRFGRDIKAACGQLATKL